MATDYVTLTRTCDGGDARTAPGDSVEVPLDGLRGARGLIAGAPDAGIEDTPTTVAERLHTAGQSVLLVDPDGSNREFADSHDVRLAGDAPDCDIRVTAGNADRIVTIAGEGETSVVLDAASFPSDEAADVIRRILESLARARRDRVSLIAVLGGCHEWLPDAGQSACTETIHAIDSQRNPGIGVIAVTDRPGAVDGQYRRDCDWIAAHRVTWREHVDAVTRILGRGYEDALESLDDGEAILSGPWLDAVERVRFESPARESDPASSLQPPSRGRSTEQATRTRESGASPSGAVADLEEEVTALRDRIADLEAAIEARTDPADVVPEIADAVADRIDPGPVTPTNTEDDATDRGTPRSDSTRDAPSREESASTQSNDGFGAVFDAFADADDEGTSTTSSGPESEAPETVADTGAADAAGNSGSEGSGGMSFEPMNFAFDEGASGETTSPEDREEGRSNGRAGERRVPRYVRDIVRTVEEMDPTTRKMLAHYVDRGADTPLNAHFSAGGSGDRTAAYAHNRQLRTTGFVEHVGRGHYSPTIPEKVRELADTELSTNDVAHAVEHVRRALP